MAIISISRGTSSGGHAVAELVARQMGYPCVGREAIANNTDWYGIPMDIPAQPSEELPSFWDRLALERSAYLDSFRAALCERAARGNLVYHGHVGHLLLPGIPILRVRIVADMEYRVEAVMRERNLTRDAAVAYIGRVDKERKEWAHYLYGVDWDDSALYDVVLNLSHLSLDAACSTVVHLALLEEFRPTAQSLRTIENLALSGRISAALARDSRTATARLEVEAMEGNATIKGVAGQEVVDALPSVLADVQGVRGVSYDVKIAA